TIIPSSAMVKLSFRLVAGQDPDHIEKAVRHWVADQLPDGIRGEVVFRPATRPCLTPLDHPALRSVVRSMERAFGRPVRYTREGGSGPAADLQDVRGAPVLLLGISLPSDGWHAPNARGETDLLLQGGEATASLWGDLPGPRRRVPGPGRRVPPDRSPPAARPARPPATQSVPPGELEAPVTTWTDHTADRPVSLTAPNGIDRAAHHRLDEAWLAAAWSHPSTRCFVVS